MCLPRYGIVYRRLARRFSTSIRTVSPLQWIRFLLGLYIRI